QSSTLEQVRQRGVLNCGVNSALPGFSQSDGQDHWMGFDVDYCKAIAAAVLDTSAKVAYLPIPRLARFSRLNSGEIDVLIRNTTWTSGRDISAGMSFVGVTYYDGQGFLAKAARGIRSVKELDGRNICVGTGTTSELNLADYFAAQGMTYRPIAFPNHDETV